MRWFNKNRCCIEILLNDGSQKTGICLIKTDVVLKSTCVVAWMVYVMFNKNRCCIEIALPLPDKNYMF